MWVGQRACPGTSDSAWKGVPEPAGLSAISESAAEATQGSGSRNPGGVHPLASLWWAQGAGNAGSEVRMPGVESSVFYLPLCH